MTDQEILQWYLSKLERNGRHYAAEYVRKYGIDAQIESGWRGEMQFEKIYKRCIEKNVRWEEIYKPEEPEAGVAW